MALLPKGLWFSLLQQQENGIQRGLVFPFGLWFSLLQQQENGIQRAVSCLFPGGKETGKTEYKGQTKTA
jgi:hypothetical protein